MLKSGWIVLLSLALVNVAAAATWKSRSAQDFQLPTPKRVGTFHHPVIHASQSVRVQKQSRSLSLVRQELIVQWGLHVFERGDALYECTVRSGRTKCEYVDFIRVATYESCFVVGTKALCSLTLSDDSESARDSDDPAIHDTFDVEPGREGGPSFDDEIPGRLDDPENPLF